MPWTGEGVARPGLPTCARVVQLANIAIASVMRKYGLTIEEAKIGFFVRVCQSVHLEPWGDLSIAARFCIYNSHFSLFTPIFFN